jgi:hypothetical protein
MIELHPDGDAHRQHAGDSIARPPAASQRRATIGWTTNEPADSQVEFGTSTSYGSTTTVNPTLTLSHSVPPTGLPSATTYHYRVISVDRGGNVTQSADFTFVTAAPVDGRLPQTSEPEERRHGFRFIPSFFRTPCRRTSRRVFFRRGGTQHPSSGHPVEAPGARQAPLHFCEAERSAQFQPEKSQEYP